MASNPSGSAKSTGGKYNSFSNAKTANRFDLISKNKKTPDQPGSINILWGKLGCNFNGGANTTVSNFIAHNFQFFIFTFLYITFAFEVDKVSTLLSLLFSMSTNFNKRFNYPIKRVHIIIPHDQAAGFINRSKNIGYF